MRIRERKMAKGEYTYVDYSHVLPDEEYLMNLEIQTQALVHRGLSFSAGYGMPGGVACNFPSKLHQVLSLKEVSHIITWMPHGRAWKILDRDMFVEKVLGPYFSNIKYSSFARQVNGWGLKRISKGEDCNCYYHELFLRGMPHLIKKMKRPSSPMKRFVPDADDEPDFYLLSIDYPLPQNSGEGNGQDDFDDILPTLALMEQIGGISCDISGGDNQESVNTGMVELGSDFEPTHIVSDTEGYTSSASSYDAYLTPEASVSPLEQCQSLDQLGMVCLSPVASSLNSCIEVPALADANQSNLGQGSSVQDRPWMGISEVSMSNTFPNNSGLSIQPVSPLNTSCKPDSSQGQLHKIQPFSDQMPNEAMFLQKYMLTSAEPTRMSKLQLLDLDFTHYPMKTENLMQVLSTIQESAR